MWLRCIRPEVCLARASAGGKPGHTPGKPAQNQQANLPDIDLAGLAAAISATGQALAAAGTTPSKSLGREAAATLRHYIRAVRGLPSRQTKAKNRQTLQIEDLK